MRFFCCQVYNIIIIVEQFNRIPNTSTPRLYLQFFDAVFASKGYHFKNIFDLTTAGDWDCVAAVERLPVLHYSVDFIFLSFGNMGFIVKLKLIKGH